jgi:pimeloyl-ACP methyl ester carboxylesterase
MATVNANEVALGIESFGDDDAPLVLLAGGTTMLSWPEALCERLADGRRRVVRYDLRDSGDEGGHRVVVGGHQRTQRRSPACQRSPWPASPARSGRKPAGRPPGVARRRENA